MKFILPRRAVIWSCKWSQSLRVEDGSLNVRRCESELEMSLTSLEWTGTFLGAVKCPVGACFLLDEGLFET